MPNPSLRLVPQDAPSPKPIGTPYCFAYFACHDVLPVPALK